MLADLLMLSTKSPAFYKCNNTTFIGSTVTACTNTVAQTVSNRKAFQNAGKIIAEENELKYLRPQPKFSSKLKTAAQLRGCLLHFRHDEDK